MLKTEASLAFNEWKAKNPELVLDDKEFFMVGEVMHFGVDGFKNTPLGTRNYDYGDKQVDFFDYGFDSLINMGFATHAQGSMDDIFSTYSKELNHGALSGVGVINYLVSHDDPEPYDKARKNPFEAALKLMLAPGAVQIYYGDELARNLTIEGAIGDATWRSFMNWDDLAKQDTQALLAHWQKLGIFRHDNLAVGAGIHKQHSHKPYVFSRSHTINGKSNQVLVALEIKKGLKTINVYDVFPNGSQVKDYYSNQVITVTNNQVSFTSPFDIALLALVAD